MTKLPPDAFATEPLLFIQRYWPGITIYKKQRDILYSVRDCPVTEVYAGNKLGKDFIAGLLVVWFFVSRPECHVVTTSVDYDQLKHVLWGEIRKFIETAAVPLPIQSNHMHLKKVLGKSVCTKSYVIGKVAKRGEGMLGHHLPYMPDGTPTTLFVADEASGVETDHWDKADSWAHRKLAIGNCFPTQNFFFQDWKAGPVYSLDGSRTIRNQIFIKGEDSPSVVAAHKEIAAGKPPSYERKLPGVLDFEEYENKRRLWDPVLQCIGLDAKFWEGAEALLYPPEWLLRSERRATELSYEGSRQALAIGIDPAEGGDKTTMAAVDRQGVIELVSKKTPDTSVITGEAIAFMNKHGVSPENVMFDAGGGGKQHADRLRRQGYDVKTVAFGGAATGQLIDARRSVEERTEEFERRYVYKNRRAEMYGLLRRVLDPHDDLIQEHDTFAIPAEYAELRRQLALIPLLYDDEGKMMMLPKGKTGLGSALRENAHGNKTLIDILGHSPDEADALVIALFCMMESEVDMSRTAGVAF